MGHSVQPPTAASLDRALAPLAETMAGELWRPTAQRRDLAPDLAALDRLLAPARVPSRPAPAGKAQDGAAGRILARRVADWDRALRAVRDCLTGAELPLLPDPPPRLDLAEAQRRLLLLVFTQAEHALRPERQDAGAAQHGCFPDLPLAPGTFLAAIHLAHRLRLARKQQRPWRFLDVGCGGGMKLAMAAEVFDDCTGIEFDPGYVAAARRTLAAMGVSRTQVVHGDALAYDGYGEFDVVYFFQPMRDDAALRRLERRILDQSRADAVLIAPYAEFALRARELGCRHLGGSVYMKEDAPLDLAALLAEARRMGPHVVREEHVPLTGGALQALWRACAANGYRPE